MDRMENRVAGSSTETAEHALAALALEDIFRPEAARQMIDRDGASVAATVAAYQASLAPLKALDGAAKAEAAQKLENALRPIGAKIAPHLAPDQAKAWLVALVAALSDLAPRTAIKAAREALHVPMQFLSEVDGHVRAKARDIEARHRRAIMRLERLMAEVAAAATPRLTDCSARPLSAEELRRLPPHIVRMGLAAGHISADDLSAAGVAPEQAAA